MHLHPLLMEGWLVGNKKRHQSSPRVSCNNTPFLKAGGPPFSQGPTSLPVALQTAALR